MSHEIEAKYKVADFNAVRRHLKALGATYRCTLRQSDDYYDTPGGMLMGRDCGLRIRTTRCLRSGGGQKTDTRALLTAKGPVAPVEGAKVRREVQGRVDDEEGLVELLEAMGLEVTVTVVKKRSSYRLGKCLIELDELPTLGCFVEIEAPGAKQLHAMADKLGLDTEPLVDHYARMVAQQR